MGGSGIFFLLVVVRAAFGALRGGLAAAILAPVFSLCFAGTALLWSPAILVRACKGLRGERWTICFMTLLLLPLRAPLVLILSLVAILMATSLWIIFATVVYDEDTGECTNLFLGGLITIGPFSGVLEVLPKIMLDWWRDLCRNLYSTAAIFSVALAAVQCEKFTNLSTPANDSQLKSGL